MSAEDLGAVGRILERFQSVAGTIGLRMNLQKTEYMALAIPHNAAIPHSASVNSEMRTVYIPGIGDVWQS